MGKTKRRDKGAGAVFRACEDRYGCPPAVELEVDGRIEKTRPKHTCKAPWAALVDLGWIDGKRRRKKLKRRDKADLVQALKDAQKQLSDTGTIATNVPTVEQWLTRWLDQIERQRVAPTTLRSHRSQIRQHIVPYLGRVRLDNLGPGKLLDWREWLRQKPAARQPKDAPRPVTMTEASILRVHSILSRALRDAVPLGYLPHGNPAAKIDRPKARRPKIPFLDAEQAALLLRHVANDALGSRWGFAFLTGQRQGETLGLRWSHLDLDRGLVDVAWQLQRLEYRHGCGGSSTESPGQGPEDRATGGQAQRPIKKAPCGRRFAGDCPDRQLDIDPDYEYEHVEGGLALMRPKGDKSRIVPVIDSMVAWLNRHRDEQGDPGPHDLVWTRPGGRPIDPRADYDRWVDLLDDAGLPRVRLHSTRHSCVSLLLALGISEPVIMQIVGHSTLAAARRYEHVDVEAARGALRMLGQELRVRELTELPAEQPQPE